MEKNIYNSLLALSGGLFTSSTLFIVFYLTGGFKNPFPTNFLGNFLYFLIFVSIIEEGVKFLLIKRDIGQYPYGFLLGFGFGIGETFLKYPLGFEIGIFSRSGAIVLHTITAGIICYFVYKKKPLLGLLIAMVIHTGFNLFLV